MTPSSFRMTRRSIRAPQEPNTAIVEPPHFSLGQVIESNRIRRRESDTDVRGTSLADLSEQARDALYQSALRYTGRYRNVAGIGDQPPKNLILSGHQPQLFHPGVWFKNVALSQWARQHRAVGIQLVIDSDLCRNNSIRVPTGSIESPSIANIPFDAASDPVPFEERSIHNADIFGSFDRNVASSIKTVVPNPLVDRFWPLAREAQKAKSNIGQVLAQARHRFEESWGLETLELPWSEVCDSRPFRHFTVAILQRCDEFRSIYNLSLIHI